MYNWKALIHSIPTSEARDIRGQSYVGNLGNYKPKNFERSF